MAIGVYASAAWTPPVPSGSASGVDSACHTCRPAPPIAVQTMPSRIDMSLAGSRPKSPTPAIPAVVSATLICASRSRHTASIGHLALSCKVLALEIGVQGPKMPMLPWPFEGRPLGMAFRRHLGPSNNPRLRLDKQWRGQLDGLPLFLPRAGRVRLPLHSFLPDTPDTPDHL
ncbi:uncharacterized protein PAN0_005c2607 [Moesziomyces antarcticus]|uniref:Uncharacterized protein n=1 Tax=Pseudozyma antarctica TaxID=84753 RepID=A0A081CCJ8_PSEA2|nr:uncharacterized protein PAN0_005c2607 [Moesziomyces antarcticus]GAK64394.1 hypothetical protein PAN0_005c2607 [Moesziomyces antarcticus]